MLLHVETCNECIVAASSTSVDLVVYVHSY
ncbi:unnamed protein product [Acanthoscelides obtectus]|uniref:Uncharacterized protein n=1 Tax=Acanthoscelides obtectus TaxID=200917 RepID=A0A9P0NUM4_ACAOB|nr:unnamed protein product [Acanthoscelides obtectus]CAK1633966.1 hypothetical protein AOBTE_LOCUS8512 [Acanthoscelides obtectus]